MTGFCQDEMAERFERERRVFLSSDYKEEQLRLVTEQSDLGRPNLTA